MLVGLSIGIWGYMWMKAFVYPPLPDTITDEEKVKAQIERLVIVTYFLYIRSHCRYSSKYLANFLVICYF